MAVATPWVAADAEAPAAPAWETPSGAALTWLTVGALFAVLGSLLLVVTAAQQIAPNLFTTGPATSFGRLRPAALTLFTYGGLGMLGGGVALELARRLSRAPVRLEPVARVAGAVTTLAVVAATVSLLFGHSTGRPLVEFRRPFGVLLALGLLLLAVTVVRTVASRERDELHPALWFVCAGVVAGPVVLLLGTLPRLAGTSDAIVTSFVGSGVLLLWLLPLGIGAALHVVPTACRAPLRSRRLATVGFWGWLLTAPFTGPARLLSGPTQDWLETVGVAATIASLVPAGAIATLLFATYARRRSRAHPPELRFALAGAGLLVPAGLLAVLHASRAAGDYLGAAVSGEGLVELLLAGVTGGFLVAGTYAVLPALTGNRLSNPRLAGAQVWLHVVGAAIVALSLLVAGYVQGTLWRHGVRTGTDTFTGAGWRTLTEALRPLLWLRVLGEAALAGSWLVLFQQTFSTTAYGEPQVSSTPPGAGPGRG